jgi:subtilisin family serine protease
MKKLLTHLLLTVFCFSIYTLSAQSDLDHVPGEILIQLRPGTDLSSWWGQHAKSRSTDASSTLPQSVSAPMNIWKIKFDPFQTDETALLQQYQRDPQVAAAQLNYYIQLRSTLPNDPQFNKQWHLYNTGQTGGKPGLDIGMNRAWDITTGGVTPGGDTIVICVVDDGIDTLHEDLRQNLWKNRQEIPNNGRDDDGNGYIDDYRGWHVKKQNDNINDDNSHGTPVSGMIGATGNNRIGVSGVNWRVKIMMVVGGLRSTTEQIIQAYTYPLIQRKLYNQTNGKKGAFVVATNSSWGIERAKAADNPIWCAFYDSLGMHGIISIGAGPDNGNNNVDVVGDMPTTCSSEFLIAVTNLDQQGLKPDGVGYGNISMDLAAFGQQVYTTALGNGYAAQSGTSFSAPLVAGAVGLLYSAPCPSLTILARKSPIDAARLVRRMLLDGTKPIASMQGITVTGGYLNVYSSLSLLLGTSCTDCPPLIRSFETQITNNSAVLNWISNDSIKRVDLRWRVKGTNTWITVENVKSPYALTNLNFCSEYEYQLKSYCRNSALDFADTYTFRTDGCCEPPTQVQFASVGATSALIRWTPITAANAYTFRYRASGANDWITVLPPFVTVNLRDLKNCTVYEFQIRSECSGGSSSAFSPIFQFKTTLCGACLDRTYCKSEVSIDQSSEEWITGVKLNSFENRSKKNGYGDFTGIPTTTLKRGQLNTLQITSGFAGPIFTEYHTVWIDYNQDGQFTTNEVVLESGARRDTVTTTQFTIPSSAPNGPTRMRVVMVSRDLGTACSISSSVYGEVEDYCVVIDNTTATQNIAPDPGIKLAVFPNPTEQLLKLKLSLPQSENRAQVSLFNLQGQQLWGSTWLLDPSGISTREVDLNQWPAGMYVLKVQTEQGKIVVEKVVKTGN